MDQQIVQKPNKKVWRKMLDLSIMIIVAVYIFLLVLDVIGYFRVGGQCGGRGIFGGSPNYFYCPFLYYIKEESLIGFFGLIFAVYAIPFSVVGILIGLVIDAMRAHKSKD